ncbi:MAG: hypothetical protein K8R86_11865 [Bacteroidales bacterium]|nr:hypothetical protein [Bacteroidales bacterium]
MDIKKSYTPAYKYEFEYESQNLVTGKYLWKLYDEWIIASSSERKFSEEKMIEYTEYNEITGGQFYRKFLLEYENDNLSYLETFDHNQDENDAIELCIYEESKLVYTHCSYA